MLCLAEAPFPGLSPAHAQEGEVALSAWRLGRRSGHGAIPAPEERPRCRRAWVQPCRGHTHRPSSDGENLIITLSCQGTASA